MRYFTFQWWSNPPDDEWAVFREYDAYLKSVKENLPPALVEFEENHTLHDSELNLISSDFQARTVLMKLNGWDRALEKAVTYNLEFRGVTLFEQDLPHRKHTERGLGDLGYWECEAMGAVTEVRLLFASGAEFRIQFLNFAFEAQSREP